MESVFIRAMPEHFGGAAYQDVSNMHPLGLAMVLGLGIATLVLPRRWATVPMLFVACFVPAVQKVVVFSCDFNLLRIIVLFVYARLLLRGEYRSFCWKRIDTLIVLHAVTSSVIIVVRQMTIGAFINRMGFSFDAMGIYFAFRCLVRSWGDLEHIIRGLILISVPTALFFLVENRTGRNVFSVFGGVPEITMAREGRLRCQGAFSHPIVAGCFWASVVPLIAAGYWKSGVMRVGSVVGTLAATFTVIMCASSTPLFGLLSTIVGGALVLYRHRMRQILWGLAAILVCLHFVMQRPVWGLIALASSLGGGTGWHRYMLVDVFIHRFGEWALMGTRSTAHWFWGAQDIANQYVMEGVNGGLLSLVLFLMIIAAGFQGVGRLWRSVRCHRYQLAVSWALGVSLFVHCMHFFGVTYFGQVHIAWYLTVGVIGSMSPAVVPTLMRAKCVSSAPIHNRISIEMDSR